MREIKFRAWSEKDERMYYDIEEISFDTEIGIVVGYSDRAENYFPPSGYGPITSYVQNVILLQYTGLKDKNGEEIYEGDIIHILDPNAISQGWDIDVRWSDSYGQWYLLEGTLDLALFEEADNCEVVGNIYENPNLLEEDNDKA